MNEELSLKINSLSVLRPLLGDPLIEALSSYLDLAPDADLKERVGRYSQFVHLLYTLGEGNPGRYIQNLVNESDNIYVRILGSGRAVPEDISLSLAEDLKILDEIASLTPQRLTEGVDCGIALPTWSTQKTDIATDYIKRTQSIDKYGYGIYAKYRMFHIGDEGEIIPVQNPDSTRLEELVDYNREQEIILDNTKALLAGKPAANVLLTGDAGTGKSSTVKAVVNELWADGLRIIEVHKDRLHKIPAILDELTQNPLKFIIFIDDLSFCRDDDNFSALKAVLEGSVSAKSKNVVIYATSNRRHLVKENFSDREGDDVHFNDTMQEILSLSERFGIQITFQRPDKSTYLDIVRKLAERSGIEYDEAKLDAAAERFALKRGMRSARAAKQFVDWLLTGAQNEVQKN